MRKAKPAAPSDKTVFAPTADWHSGASAALFPPNWVNQEGNKVEQNPLQKIIWQQWCESWEEVRKERQGGRLIVPHVGDAVEGLHHDTHQVMTSRIEEQERIHMALALDMQQRVGWKPETDRMVYIVGTAAHTGSGGASEERIARSMLKAPKDGPRVSLYHWKPQVNEVLFDFAHQGPPPGARHWLTGNLLQAYMRSFRDGCNANKRPVPRFFIRAHRHQQLAAAIYDESCNVEMEGFLLPCWTMKGEYAQVVAPNAAAHIGLLIITVGDGAPRWRWSCLQLEQDGIEEL